ncbi:hypothetical protein [Mangrovibacterium sp.]|uniref:hypothetical protein n=1 Tax=Mangrovibacterium sp. TaxID=1961364 RepID=UPI00356176C0
MNRNPKQIILSWLLHHANREASSHYFYQVKDLILQKHARVIGYEIQFIEGKKCWTCKGTGKYMKYDHYTGWYSEPCWHCYNGWYHRPVWVILQKYQFGKYTFLKPIKSTYEKPETNVPVIKGYIDHEPSKYGEFALFILLLLYEKGFMKRWWRESGWRWYRNWYYPCNWAQSAIHIFKRKQNSIPAQRIKRSLLKLRYRLLPAKSQPEPEELPF